MLYEFIDSYRDAIIIRSHEKLSHHPWPLVSTSESAFGVPLFLTQLADSLRSAATAAPLSQEVIGASAAKHGRELLALGFNVSQVVHSYGDICQAITDVALEQRIPISTEEFHTLNRCLDTAIAEAVTEHSRLSALSLLAGETERSGQAAHELRDILQTALLAFHALRRGDVAIGGSTGTLLGRSLIGLRDLVDNSLAEVRMTAKIQNSEAVSVETLLREVAIAGLLHSEYRAVPFTVDPVDASMVVIADRQLLGSAVMNLLNNAFKYTRVGGPVILRAVRGEQRVRIEVEDECGGLAVGAEDLFKPFCDRRKNDRSGLGLGLSIAAKAVRIHGGELQVRNLPGKGCVFVIDLPLVDAPEALAVSPAQ